MLMVIRIYLKLRTRSLARNAILQKGRSRVEVVHLL